MYLISIGTRPEVIKLFPLITEFKNNNIDFKTLFTGQHKNLQKTVSNLIPKFDFELNVMKKGQSLNSLMGNILKETDKIFKNNKFNYVIVQGDTASSFAIALSAFYYKIKIIHIEAGLRTHNKYEPFPEEINRKMLSHIADLHFVPTEISKTNLLNEKINEENIYIVGNTIIDALRLMKIKCTRENKVIITIHRRENRKYLELLYKQINEISKKYKLFNFIVIKHPSISDNIYNKYLTNVTLIDPLPYSDFLKLLSKCIYVISDSGGIQEEVTYMKKKILIVRNITERPEVVNFGYGKIVGINININNNIEWAMKPLDKNTNEYPFGDGYSSSNIVKILKKINK